MPPARSRLRFAPVSGAPSALLRLASGYFLLNGVFTASALLAAIATFVREPASFGGPWMATLVFAFLLFAAWGQIWTGLLLSESAKLGGNLGLMFVLLPLLLPVLQGHSPGGFDVIWSLLSLSVLLSIWRELK